MSARNNYKARLNSIYRGLGMSPVVNNPVAPPKAALDAAKAEAATKADPLRYVLGDPPPGRSALDKRRAR